MIAYRRQPSPRAGKPANTPGLHAEPAGFTRSAQQPAEPAYNQNMADGPSAFPTIRALRRALASSAAYPLTLAEEALARSNQNTGRNTYLWQDTAWTRAEAGRAGAMLSNPDAGAHGAFADGRAALWGLPVSVKDCFDLAGAPTTCGVRFYRDRNGIAAQDSWLVAELRRAGAVITGKTHLHALAYGITGENPEFGDCIQPGAPGALTGGSSSGAVASVLEGSAVAAIGTDTGGSIRVPASLAGLAGYRATLGRGHWRGGAHLAESFDTLGWLFRSLADAPLLAAPFAPASPAPTRAFSRFALVADDFLSDCEPAVLASYHAFVRELQSLGLEAQTVDPAWWREAVEIFAPLQASEAALLHAGHFEQFEPAIRERLKWGASLKTEEVADLRRRHAEFRSRMEELFATHGLIALPCAPVARLQAGADHSQTRARLLRYTAPFSLSGTPAVAIPCATGGVQLSAARESDESLLALAAQIGEQRNPTSA
jgi:Asp-tRNA(Asn)/Glu-tRNA(Gln) amidotransferase A subunit family amidase